VTISLNPPLTAIFTYLFFGIGVTFYFFVGGSIMLTGILIVTLDGSSGTNIMFLSKSVN